MKKIITIAGSNSQKSINKRLLFYSSSLIENVEIIPIDLNDYDMPIYGVDYETEYGIPTAAKELNELLDKADGFILALAEHNGTYTSVFKNTLDWLSRANIKVWRDKPTFLMATSPGGRGGATVLEAAVSYFPYLGANVTGHFSLPSFFDNFSEDAVSNAEFKEELTQKVELFEQQLNI
jgi:NAD(P)H-dependent FMN reductase